MNIDSEFIDLFPKGHLMGSFKSADFGTACIGEGAFDITEEFAIQKFSVYRGTIYLNNRTPGTLTALSSL
jgi:hypothetical protein